MSEQPSRKKKEFVFETEDDLKKAFLEAVEIIQRENYYLDLWKRHFGSFYLNNLKAWRTKAKLFLEKHGVPVDVNEK